MNVREQIDGYLREIGSRLGVSLSLDVNDTCSLLCADDLQVNVSSPSESDQVILHAPLMPVDPQQRSELFQRALTMNLYGGETEGCWLAFDPSLNAIVLCYVHAAASLDAGGFGNLLGNFIASAQRVLASLESPSGQTTPTNAEQSNAEQSPEISAGMMQNLHLRA